MTEISPPRGLAYRAYLVRLWQDGPGGPWRALTRDAETQEERRFATVEQLFLFLHRQTEGGGSDDTGRTSHDQPRQSFGAVSREEMMGLEYSQAQERESEAKERSNATE